MASPYTAIPSWPCSNPSLVVFRVAARATCVPAAFVVVWAVVVITLLTVESCAAYDAVEGPANSALSFEALEAVVSITFDVDPSCVASSWYPAML